MISSLLSALITTLVIFSWFAQEGSEQNKEVYRESELVVKSNRFLDRLYEYTLNKNYFANHIVNDSLTKYLKGDETLIFYYNYDACGTCITEIYADLNLIKDRIPLKLAVLEGGILDSNNNKPRNEFVEIPRFFVKEKPFDNISLIITNPSLEIICYYNYDFNVQFKNIFFEKVLPKYFYK